MTDPNDVSAYAVLLGLVHPSGLCCPRCRDDRSMTVHRRRREPVIDYRCSRCGAVFNAWTGTVLEGIHRRPTEVLTILDGIRRGAMTAELARQLGCQRRPLGRLIRRVRPLAERREAACGRGVGGGRVAPGEPAAHVGPVALHEHSARA